MGEERRRAPALDSRLRGNDGRLGKRLLIAWAEAKRPTAGMTAG